MPPESEPKLAPVEAIPPRALDPNPRQARAAIKRCVTAWQRVYDARMKGTNGDAISRGVAVREASPAYCEALPPLAGYECTRDFIACVAHGILINAIPQKRANQLLYAAQVALATLHHEPKPRKPA